jgi:mono/diheme cytochrome c family protein
MANCGACHGPDAPVAGSGGIRFIGDLDALVAAGLIVPLSSAASPIVRVMRDGSMPPPSAGRFPVTNADLQIVVEYIDNPRFWPEASPPALVDAGSETPVVDAGTLVDAGGGG